MSIDLLESLKETIKNNNLLAKKSLGQNFLFDLNITKRMVQAVGDLENLTIVEVGPGPGALTRAIASKLPSSYVAIEKDSRFIPILEEIQKVTCPFGIMLDDALSVSYEEIYNAHGKKPLAIIANLPYNIATPLLIGWLKKLPFIHSLTLMLQKEVVQRILAKPDTSAYGRLGVLCQWLCEGYKVIEIPPSAFIPQPKVTSAVVHLRPKKNFQENFCLFESFEKVTHHAFCKRRKMIKSSLKDLFDLEKLEDLGLTPTNRAEVLQVEDFVKLAKAL
ncbi:MAG TPA: 16S rRNA (adenine(1518)-N(6)/adenine(1519)-N(6))-dimethyltransferase RsmA [Alphaproteobacteria bacterium]|nr:16S rRNA (adenine(1518)-N(6)/adenine(1519)-N(6))-dimethyltransferase RsmA [Alphaproteobacteria bacterium]